MSIKLEELRKKWKAEGRPKKKTKRKAGTAKPKKKFEEDAKTFRSWWKGTVGRMESGWIQAVYARGEKYLRQYEMKATEQKMIDLVRESRDEVDEIILSRIWNDLKVKSEEAVKRGAYAEAIGVVESMEDPYLYFQEDPKKVLTKAGDLHQKYLTTLRDEDLPRAYLSDREALSKATGLEAYTLIAEMFDRYGDVKRDELFQLRTTHLMV